MKNHLETRVLTPDEERALLLEYHRTRNPALARRLVMANLRLVYKVANAACRDRRFLPDLYQEGCIGLLMAIQRFDPARNVRLGTYATWWIRSHVFKLVRQLGRVVNPGDSRAERARFIAGERAQPDLSLDAPVSADGGRGTHLAFLPAPDDARPDVVVEERDSIQRQMHLIDAFSQDLDAREHDLFRQRWKRESPRTLAEVGRRHGVSRERARQIEKSLLHRLHNTLSADSGLLAAG